jgi:hypothetical protein
VLTSPSPLPSRLWRLNKELDRTPHTDQSNYRLLDRRTEPVSTGIMLGGNRNKKMKHLKEKHE